MSRITERGATGPLAIQAGGVFPTQAQSIQVYGGTATDSSLSTLLGSRWDLSDGREVALILSGAIALAAGKLNQDAAIVPNHQNLAVTAVQAYSANGNTPATVTVTLGATAATANQYAGGFLIVNDNVGEGQTLKIASHPAAALSTSLVVTLEDGPNTALTTASEVCLILPHGANVVVFPTTATGAVAGVTLYPIPAAAYGFVVTKGIVACLADGAVTVGAAISPSNAVAGAVEDGVIAQGLVGNANQAGVDTEYRSIFINV